jgi:hypothetical protein
MNVHLCEHESQPKTPIEENLLEKGRGLSIASYNDYTLENEIKLISEQMNRILTICELQSQNPLRLQEKMNDLKQQIELAVTEKNYWIKRYKVLAEANLNLTSDENFAEDIRKFNANTVLQNIITVL